MVAVMPAASDAIANLVAHVESLSNGRAARRPVADPDGGACLSPGGMAAEIRGARGAEQDRLVLEALAVESADGRAELTVLAGLSERLGGVVAGWRRAGVTAAEVEVMAADLVSSAWIVVDALARDVRVGAVVPARLAWHVVDEAREQVRVPRRRERRAAAASVPFDAVVGWAAGTEAHGGERLTGVLVDAVREGRLSRGAAASVFMTRVAGWKVAETAQRLGCAEVSVRVARMRAERHLAA
jgi:DNA-directed RNA polymerase specialized sigma24 family protein